MREIKYFSHILTLYLQYFDIIFAIFWHYFCNIFTIFWQYFWQYIDSICVVFQALDFAQKSNVQNLPPLLFAHPSNLTGQSNLERWTCLLMNHQHNASSTSFMIFVKLLLHTLQKIIQVLGSSALPPLFMQMGNLCNNKSCCDFFSSQLCCKHGFD